MMRVTSRPNGLATANAVIRFENGTTVQQATLTFQGTVNNTTPGAFSGIVGFYIKIAGHVIDSIGQSINVPAGQTGSVTLEKVLDLSQVPATGDITVFAQLFDSQARPLQRLPELSDFKLGTVLEG